MPKTIRDITDRNLEKDIAALPGETEQVQHETKKERKTSTNLIITYT